MACARQGVERQQASRRRRDAAAAAAAPPADARAGRRRDRRAAAASTDRPTDSPTARDRCARRRARPRCRRSAGCASRAATARDMIGKCPPRSRVLGSYDGADHSVAIDRPQMHADARELAVERRDHALAAGCRGAVGSGSPCIAAGGGDAGDRAERRREIDVPDRLVDDGRRDRGARRGPPDERHAHQRVDVVRALEDQSGVAPEIAVVRREEDVGVLVLPALGEHASTRPSASSTSSFSTWIDVIDLAELIVREQRRARSSSVRPPGCGSAPRRSRASGAASSRESRARARAIPDARSAAARSRKSPRFCTSSRGGSNG